MKEKNQEIKELEKELKEYNRDIKRNLERKRESASVYYEKANALVKLSQLTQDSSTKQRINDKVIKCYKKAIELSPTDRMYIVDRSKFYVSMGQNELAVEDIRKLKSLPEANDYVLTTYISNTISDITELDKVKTTVTKLLGDGKIDQEFADALTAHTDITARLVVQVGTHSDILVHHSNEITELKSYIVELRESSKREIRKLKQKTANYEIQLQINTTTIQYHKKIIENSDLIDEVQTREDLKKIQHPELQAYCKTFYWSMINLFNTYEMLSSNLIKGNIYKNENIINKLLKDGTEKVLKLGGTVAAHGIPFLGGVVAFTAETTAEIIESVYEAVKINEFNNEVNSINLIIQNKFGPLDNMSLKLAQLALSVTQIKEDAILHPQKSNPTKLKARIDWFQDKIGSIKNKLLPSTELYSKDNYSVQLALQDVTLLILYLHKNLKTVIQENTPLEIQFETIITQGGLDKLLINMQENEKFIEIEQRIGQKILDSIHKKAEESNWDGTSRFSLKSNKAKEGVKKYLEEDYITKHFKVESQGDIENIRICIFEHICIGTKQNPKCVIEFSKIYPKLIEKMANNYPELFRNKLIAETCIENEELQNKVIKTLNIKENEIAEENLPTHTTLTDSSNHHIVEQKIIGENNTFPDVT